MHRAFRAYLFHYWEAKSLYRIHSPLFFELLSRRPPTPRIHQEDPYTHFLQRLTEQVGPVPLCAEWPETFPAGTFAVVIPNGDALWQWQQWRRRAPGVVVTFPRMGIHLRHPRFKESFSLPLYPPQWYPGCRG